MYYFYTGLNIPSSWVTEIYIVSAVTAHEVAEPEITEGLTQLDEDNTYLRHRQTSFFVLQYIL